ncbi:hypothetical protein GC177_05165 [bacterium]|nr:hypothetical protein [bacterium]
MAPKKQGDKPIKQVGEKGIEGEAEKLANYIREHLLESASNRDVLAQAIEAIWGSVEKFYEEFFLQLTPQERAQFGEKIDQLVSAKKDEKLKIFHLLADDAVRRAAQALAMAGVGGGVKTSADTVGPAPSTGTGTGKGSYGKDQRRKR